MPNTQTRCRMRVQLVQQRVQMQKQKLARRRCVVNSAKLDRFLHLKENPKCTLYIVQASYFLINYWRGLGMLFEFLVSVAFYQYSNMSQ